MEIRHVLHPVEGLISTLILAVKLAGQLAVCFKALDPLYKLLKALLVFGLMLQDMLEHLNCASLTFVCTGTRTDNLLICASH